MSGQQHATAASTPGKDPVLILQEAGWAPGPVWTGGKSSPNRDSIPDRPGRSSVAIPTELPDQSDATYSLEKKKNFVKHTTNLPATRLRANAQNALRHTNKCQ